MSTDCRLFPVMTDKISEKSQAQEIDAIAHVSISTLFLHSDCSELTNKHLFDFRYYLLLCGRTFSLTNTPIPLSRQRGYAVGARYNYRYSIWIEVLGF